MIKVIVQKNLIGLNDLLLGFGTVEQVRGPNTSVTITKINSTNFPYDASYSMTEIIDYLQLELDNLPEVVDNNNHLLTGLINSSTSDLDLNNRLWRKSIDANIAEIYYYNELLFQYEPTLGDILIPPNTDYVQADTAVTEAFQTADVVLQEQIDSLGPVSQQDAGTDAEDVVVLDGTSKLPVLDASNLLNLPLAGIPLGSVFYVAHTTIDPDYVLCDGSELDRITYAALYVVMGTIHGVGNGATTFNLPDLRGEFTRGLDNDKGVDIGRTLGSNQEEAFKSHLHGSGNMTIPPGTDSTHTIISTVGYLRNEYHSDPGTSSPHTHSISGDVTSVGGAETRPRNIALNPIMKAL